MKPLHKNDCLYIISFDVSCNKRRRKISNLLQDSGIRVQGSVFEIYTSQIRIKTLAEQLEAIAGCDANIRIYPMTRKNAASTITINSGRPINAGEPWVF